MSASSEPDRVRAFPGVPAPLGVVPARSAGRDGVNAAIVAPHATAVELCLFDTSGGSERARYHLARIEDVWCGFVAGEGVGSLYGLRASGPWAPRNGHRFDPMRLLIDPWARSLAGDFERLAIEAPGAGAARIPKARVVDPARELAAGAAIAPGPRTSMARTVLYEVHVRALTALHPDVPEAQRGSYAGVASDCMLAHYARLGVTSLCLLPVHLHIDERHLVERGLRNHWGYNTLGYFVPEHRYASRDSREQANLLDDAAVRAEFRAMVDRLHRHGIEVILDVVFNHTAESDLHGPTLSWRGLDNAAFYALDEDGAYVDSSGCGNSLEFGRPRVVQMVMDSLRWWVEAYGVDGFRFDLAVTLGRDPALDRTFHPRGAFLAAMRQDPVLSATKWIAEPWDLGPDGYRLGGFEPGWHEWNDRFRDTVRAWWLGHPATNGQLAMRVTGSSDSFDPARRAPLAGINLITAHDGFTLADLTSYELKHNEANGEGNRDGHDHNLSANGGVEGPTDDPRILDRRGRWRRALLATLAVSQGVPQLLAGDEIAQSQQGNNNAYCQDNRLTWLDWAAGDQAQTDFVAGLFALRKRYPGLRRAHWFTGEGEAGSACGHPDICWRTAQGKAPTAREWNDDKIRFVACVVTAAEESDAPSERLMLIFHGSATEVDVVLPAGDWRIALDSGKGEVQVEALPGAEPVQDSVRVGAASVLLLVQALACP